MKVLFAVNNENISNLIVKKYQKDYKEIISSKNVYYFNAILKELQKDKNYDRIVISEDLEQFTNSNYQQMDKFIFDRLDSISDEASNMQGEDIPIILLCSERRAKGEEILVKLFGIGIYNAVIGKDRDINEVCKLLNKPRSKKEAKEYYRIDTDDVNYHAENENDVSEIEIQNILAHYKRLGKNEERYVESFDNIALQYNDIQLKIICKFLPLNVRAVLEEKSPKYQKLMAFNKSVSEALKGKEKKDPGTSEKLLVTPNSKQTLSKPVVIPTTVKSGQVKKLTNNQVQKKVQQPKVEDIFEDIFTDIVDETEETKEEITQQKEDIIQEPKRGRGRPRKVQETSVEEKVQESQPKRGRGRPKKVQEVIEELPIMDLEEEVEESGLPGLDDFDDFVKSNTTKSQEDDFLLPGFDEEEDEDTNNQLPGFEEDDVEEENDGFSLPGFGDEEEEEEEEDYPANPFENSFNQEKNLTVSNYQEYNNNIDLSGLLTREKKVVTFVGTSKNGTSFVLNNLAELLSSQGINVAILDATKNRNAYYIYTKNEESLRRTASESIKNLSNGTAKGIRVNSNLTVYTSLPAEGKEINNVGTVLETLVQNHSLILIDCDFETPIEYFANAQEMYLVQTMDVLTIQPLTAFLRELKAKKILEEEKIRIIINKYVRLHSVNEKAIIGGMAYYNDPAMSFMTELFNRNTVKYFTIPFEEDIYAKYLEGLINCDISLRGYSKTFMQILKQLGNSVYPLISAKSAYQPAAPSYQSNFSSNINNTLNQMKRNY